MKRILLILVSIIGVLAIAAIFFFAFPPTPEPGGDASQAWADVGKSTVIEDDIRFIDESRPTQAYGTYDGDERRVLVGKVWRPEAASNAPLVIYSHGFMSSHAGGEDLGRFLASHGYIVAAVDYPLTHGGAPSGPLVTDFINQPVDASFLIDSLIQRSRNPEDALAGAIDVDRIAAVGLSLGGLTTQLLAFHPGIGDERIRAAISIAGPTANLTRRFFEHRRVPFVMIAGESDAIVTYAANAIPVLDKVPGAYLVTLDNASHTGFAAQAASFFRFTDHPDEVVCPMLLENLDNGGEQPLVVSDPSLGFDAEVDPDAVPCQNETFERAMRPHEQVMLTRLIVYAFLESHLANDPARRDSAGTFFTKQLAAENEAIRVQTANL